MALLLIILVTLRIFTSGRVLEWVLKRNSILYYSNVNYVAVILSYFLLIIILMRKPKIINRVGSD